MGPILYPFIRYNPRYFFFVFSLEPPPYVVRFAGAVYRDDLLRVIIEAEPILVPPLWNFDVDAVRVTVQAIVHTVHKFGEPEPPFGGR